MSSMNVLLPASSHKTMRFVNLGRAAHHLPALEQEDSVLAHVKDDIAVLVVVHVARKVTSYNAMPTSIVLLVELTLYIPSNLLKKGNVSTFGISQPTKNKTSVYRHTPSSVDFPIACVAQSTASSCISFGMSALMITALPSDILVDLQQYIQHNR